MAFNLRKSIFSLICLAFGTSAFTLSPNFVLVNYAKHSFGLNVNEKIAVANSIPSGLTHVRVCNNEKNYRADFNGVANGSVDRVEFKLKS